MRAGPSGEERGTPHYTVPIYPQCPQEIGLLALPVFQGAAVSSEYFSQFLLPGNVAELRGFPPPLWGSLEQPPINGVIPTLVGPEQALVMEQEVSTLLRKEAIEMVPPLDKEFGFYSRPSLFLGRMGGCVPP